MSRVAALVAADEIAPARPYAERSEAQPGWHDRAAEALFRAAVQPLRDLLRDPARALRAILPAVGAHERRLRACDDAELRRLAAGLRSRPRRLRLRADRRVLCSGARGGRALARQAAL